MKYPLILVATAALVSVGCAGPEHEAHYQTVPRMPAMRTWSDQIASWPEASKRAAREMGNKYGAPHEVTETQLVWYEHGPWKRAILSREGTPHDWPQPHIDVLEQVIDFRVDASKADEIARFDGGVTVDRAKGELSASCGGEAGNFLAINLARDIAIGKRRVEDARSFYEQAVAQAAVGEDPEQMQGLMFGKPERTKEVAKRKAATPEAEQSVKRTVSP